jgi:hypothetical protein
MDPLSDVLRAVRLDGAFFYFVEARHPWSVEAVPAVELVPRVLPEAEHLISYHILVEGECWGGLSGEAQVCLQPGDVIVFPHGDPHFMSSAEGRRVDPGPMNTAPDRYLETVRIGAESGARASFVCEFLRCAPPASVQPLAGGVSPSAALPGRDRALVLSGPAAVGK